LARSICRVTERASSDDNAQRVPITSRAKTPKPQSLHVDASSTSLVGIVIAGLSPLSKEAHGQGQSMILDAFRTLWMQASGSS
jgi:hypothetical protein